MPSISSRGAGSRESTRPRRPSSGKRCAPAPCCVRKGQYRFLHDRVHEAAIAMTPEEQRAELHLRIGRILLAHIPRRGARSAYFRSSASSTRRPIASRIPQSACCWQSSTCRRQPKRARRPRMARPSCIAPPESTCFPRDAWQSQRPLAYALHLEQVQSEYLNQSFERAELLLSELIAHCETVVERAAPCSVGIQLYAARGDLSQGGGARHRIPAPDRLRPVEDADARGRGGGVSASARGDGRPPDRGSRAPSADDRPGEERADDGALRRASGNPVRRRQAVGADHLPRRAAKSRARHIGGRSGLLRRRSRSSAARSSAAIKTVTGSASSRWHCCRIAISLASVVGLDDLRLSPLLLGRTDRGRYSPPRALHARGRRERQHYLCLLQRSLPRRRQAHGGAAAGRGRKRGGAPARFRPAHAIRPAGGQHPDSRALHAAHARQRRPR